MENKLILVDLFNCITDNKFTRGEINFVKQSSKNNFIIFYLLGEKYPLETINSCLQIFFNRYSRDNIFLICDRLTMLEDIDKLIIKNIIILDSQLVKVAQYEEATRFNNTINLDSSKFLYLMGKPYKENRLPFLYQLYRNKLLKHCDYSFYYNEEYAEITRNIMYFLSDNKYDNFIKDTKKILDTIDFSFDVGFFHYYGLPTDPNLYKNTSFSVISETETDVNNFYFISEKTWRTIANKHMFVSMAHKGYKDFLNNIGISTFDYCLKYKKQHFNITDSNARNILTVKNIEFLLENIEKYKSEIKADIENNYKVYRQLVEKQRQLVNFNIEKELHISSLHGSFQALKVFSIDKKIKKALTALTKEYK
jgi:hypothetical protein